MKIFGKRICIKKPVPAQAPQQNQIQNWQITNLNEFNVNFIS